MTSERTDEKIAQRIVMLAKTWTLADQIIRADLQNVAMSAMLAIMRDYAAPFEAMQSVCSLAPTGSTLSAAFAAVARYQYFKEGSLWNDDLATLMMVPGFLNDFMEPVKDAIDGCEEIAECGDLEPAWAGDWDFSVELD